MLCHRHLLPGVFAASLVLLFGGTIVFIVCSVLTGNAKEDRDKYVPVTLMRLEDGVWRAETPSIEVNCTLVDSVNATSGYIQKRCFEDRDYCICLTQLPEAAAVLKPLVIFRATLFGICALILALIAQPLKANSPMCCCIPSRHDDKPVCDSWHGRC